MNNQDFWSDNEKAQKVIQENKALKDTVEEYNKLTEALEEIELLIEIGLEEDDDSICKEIENNILKKSISLFCENKLSIQGRRVFINE